MILLNRCRSDKPRKWLRPNRSAGVDAPKHDKEMARRFLAGLDPNSTRFTFQFFNDRGSGGAQIIHGTLDELWPKVLALNTPQQGVGVFVTIAETDFQG